MSFFLASTAPKNNRPRPRDSPGGGLCGREPERELWTGGLTAGLRPAGRQACCGSVASPSKLGPSPTASLAGGLLDIHGIAVRPLMMHGF